MILKFHNPQLLDKNLKATVHKSGKLGFTVEAARKLGLSSDMGLAIATNDADSSDFNLYVVVHPTATKDTFKVSKAGQYYYVNTKNLFDNLKWDYKDQTMSFDITTDHYEGQPIYKFIRRVKNSEV